MSRRLAILTALLLCAAACDRGDGGADKAADAAQEARPVPVQVATARRGDIQQHLQSAATLSARREVLLLAEANGHLSRVTVEEGDPVKAGQELALLTNRQLEQAVPTAELTLSRLRQERQNLQPLLDKGYAPRQSAEELDHQIKQAQQQLSAARGQLQALRVRAPFDGLIARRAALPGQQVAPGAELFYLVDPAELEIVLQVPELSLAQLREGTTATVTADALGPQRRFPARVRLINPVVNPRTGTVKVTLTLLQTRLDGPDAPTLRPGMLAQAQLLIGTHNDALLAPRRALLRDDEQPRLFIVEDTPDGPTARRREVQTGLSEGELIEILSGLQDGDRVIVLGQAGLKDGARVQVVTP